MNKYRQKYQQDQGQVEVSAIKSKRGFNCQGCDLYLKTCRIKPIVQHAPVLVLGDYPTAYDVDHAYEGPARHMLIEICEASGLRLSDISIGFLINCRPEKDEEGKTLQPTEHQIQQCSRQFQEMVRTASPRIIVAYGRHVTKQLLPDVKGSPRTLRGRMFEYEGIPVLPTLNPTLPLYSGSDTEKKLIFQDFTKVRGFLEGSYSNPLQQVTITEITSEAEMEDLIEAVGDYPIVARDIETAPSYDPYLPDAKILSHALCWDLKQAFWVPMMHRENTRTCRTEESIRWWHEAYARLMQRCNRIVYHNATFDFAYETYMLYKYAPGFIDFHSIPIEPSQIECSMILNFVLYNAAKGDTDEAEGTYSLKMLAQSRGYPDWDSEMKEKYFKGLSKAEINYELIPLPELGKYNAYDCIPTLDLRNEFITEMMTTDLGQIRLKHWDAIVQEMVGEFAIATMRGLEVDFDAWNKTQLEYTQIRQKRLLEFVRLPQVMSWLVKKEPIATRNLTLPEIVSKETIIEVPGRDPVTTLDKKGDYINIDSPDQMRDLLIDHTGLPTLKSGKSGASLDGEALGMYQAEYWNMISNLTGVPRKPVDKIADERLEKFLTIDLEGPELYALAERTVRETSPHLDKSLNYVVARHLLLARQVNHLIKNYIHPIPHRTSHDGIFHPRYKLHGTVTGRLSSFFHTLPWDNRVKVMFRSKFGPHAKDKRYYCEEEGYIIAADYSGIEAKLSAIFADDGRNISPFLKAYQDGVDVHRVVAGTMLQKPTEEVTDSERKLLKSCHFLKLYLGSPAAAARTVWNPDMVHTEDVKGVSGIKYRKGDPKSLEFFTEEMKGIFERYDAGFPNVTKFYDRVQKMLREKGISTPLSIHAEEFKHLFRDNPVDKKIITPMYRVLNMETDMDLWSQQIRPVNWATQATAADLTSTALVRISKRLRDAGMKSHCVSSVHDSIYVDVFPPEMRDVGMLVYAEMEDRTPYPWFNAPLIADVEVGRSSLGYLSRFNRDGTITEVDQVKKGYRKDKYHNVVEI